jgi:AcrR family transcriptional regulator
MLVPRTPEQNEKIRQLRIAQIMKAGMEVYLEKGVRGMEIGDVADRAGLGRGTIYHYYDNKIELLKDLFIKTLDNAKQTIVDTLMEDNRKSAIERLEDFYRAQIEVLAHTPLLFKFYKNLYDDVPLIFGEQADVILDRFLNELYEPIVGTFREAVSEGQLIPMEPLRLTQLFWGALIGAATIFIEQNLLNEPALVDEIILMLFNGIKVRNN